jgi:hypothetical protein
MQETGLGEEPQQELAQRVEHEVFERADETVNLSVDDVGVKKQKAQRLRRLPSASAGAAHAETGCQWPILLTQYRPLILTHPGQKN